MGNLLVIDFDYFFVNKLEAGWTDDEAFMLYDWSHNESELYRLHIWPTRAAGFLINDMPLPQVEIPDNWWDRFTISPDAVCTVSDSNAFSGVMEEDADPYKHVWLFDAHHDLYKIKTPEQLEEWGAKNAVSCEDWMFAHFVRGSKLHWRWPRWHKLWERSDVPKFVNCDARKDDMGKLDTNMKFDAVSICRSGCWVPPWCDDAFYNFVLDCPVSEIIEVEDGCMEPRPWKQATDVTVQARQMYMPGAPFEFVNATQGDNNA